MALLSFQLEGLTCGGCVSAVRKALEQQSDVAVIELTQTQLSVETPHTAEEIITWIAEAGFEAIAL
jgi:copper chaperone CopZ